METRSGLCLKNLNILSNPRRQLGLKRWRIYIYFFWKPPHLSADRVVFFFAAQLKLKPTKKPRVSRERASPIEAGVHKALSCQCLRIQNRWRDEAVSKDMYAFVALKLRSTISRNDNRVIVKVSTGERRSSRIAGSSLRIVCSVNIVICLVNLVRPKGPFSSGTLALRRSEESNPSSTY